MNTAWKESKYRVHSGLYFPVFGLSTGKYGPEKTPYLDTFRAEEFIENGSIFLELYIQETLGFDYMQNLYYLLCIKKKKWKMRFARLPQGTWKCWVTEIVRNTSTYGAYRTVFQKSEYDMIHFFLSFKENLTMLFSMHWYCHTTINKDKTIKKTLSASTHKLWKCACSNVVLFEVNLLLLLVLNLLCF